jgi:hypothetical protein
MTAVADRTRLPGVRALRAWLTGLREGAVLKLVPDGDGWSLVRSDGELVFQAAGVYGRHACLAFASAAGVLTVLS